MTVTFKTQEDLNDSAQAESERKISELRQRLKSAERQAASESAAHEDQAKLAETMVRAARAEAREREALTRANAEMTALVRSMEDELEALKVEHAAARAPAPEAQVDAEQPAVAPVDAASPVPEIGETPPLLKRKSIWAPRIAIAVLCLAAVGVGVVLYPVVAAFLDDRAGLLMGRVTVINGDTIRIDGKTVRLLGIDAPLEGTPAGMRASRYLHRLTAGQDVRCESDGRRVGGGVQAQCFIGTVDIGQIMMLSGNAVLRQSALRGDYHRP